MLSQTVYQHARVRVLTAQLHNHSADAMLSERSQVQNEYVVPLHRYSYSTLSEARVVLFLPGEGGVAHVLSLLCTGYSGADILYQAHLCSLKIALLLMDTQL